MDKSGGPVGKSRPSPGRDVGLLSLVCLLAGFLSGCVYLRLLEVKKQLQQFDANFSIGGRMELEIQFLHPVMHKKDARFLIGSNPTEEWVQAGEVRQHYKFELLRHSTAPVAPMAHLDLELAMVNNRLVKIIVPERFMMLFPRDVIVETLKQAKDAEVFELKKLARGRIRLDPDVEAQLPSRDKTLLLMGDPLALAKQGDLDVFTYQYEIPNAKRDVLILTQLSFDPKGLLRQAFVHWDQSSIEAIFERP